MTRVALITGGQQGIGFAIATALRAEGYRIAIASLPPSDDANVQSALEQLGPDCVYVQHDVADVASNSTLLDQVEDAIGPVTTLVNNAGVGSPVRGDLLDVTPRNWDFVQNINLRGAFFLSQEVARRMLAQTVDTYRSILFVTSVSAEMISVERAEYCVSKAGASMMAKLFATRLAANDIGVFELRPGIIATEMTAGVRDKYTSRIEGGLVPAARWGEAGDVGQTAAALASGQMRFATGAAIPVDGGLSLPRL